MAETARRRISVVIPAFDRQRQLNHALQSLASEEAHILDIVVVDDASPEPIVVNAPELLRHRVKLVRLDANVGSSAARQIGVDHSHGELVAFLDSDDIWLPGKLDAQLPYFRDGGDMLAVATGWQVVSPAESKAWCRTPVPANDPADFASGCWFCPGSTVIISRAALDRCGPFDPKLRRLEDLDWFLRFALEGGRLEVADVYGAVIHRNKGRNRPLVDAAALHIEHKFLDRLDPNSPVFRKLVAWLDVERAFAAYAVGRHWDALRLMLRSFARVPRRRIQLKRWWKTAEPIIPLAEIGTIMGSDAS